MVEQITGDVYILKYDVHEGFTEAYGDKDLWGKTKKGGSYSYMKFMRQIFAFPSASPRCETK